MSTQRETHRILTILILLFMSFSYANAYDIKPDITNNATQQNEPRSWNRNNCCYPATPYEATKTMLEDKLFESEHFIKLSDMLSILWEKHTHQR